MGAGNNLIELAVEEGQVRPLDFLWKMLLTALTMKAGFRGGEIVPSFCIGATFGCLMGHLLGISPSLCAAAGMAALFCGVTNCPITSILIAFELFGFRGVSYYLSRFPSVMPSLDIMVSTRIRQLFTPSTKQSISTVIPGFNNV